MTKGRATKNRILQQAAELFNRRGYAGSSMADVMRVTGLQKGGIYNHFSSKDDLALAAFNYSIALLRDRQRQVLKGTRTTRDRLHALVQRGYLRSDGEPLMPGGCPLLNTAVESDDAHPELKAKAQDALDKWHQMLTRIVTLGIKKGEVASSVNAAEVATIIISTLEGAMMMSELSGQAHHRQVAIAYLSEYIDQLCDQRGMNV